MTGPQPSFGPPPPGPQPVYGQPPYGQPPYGQPPYGQPPYGQPGMARPRPTSTRGPKITFFFGVGALLLTIALAVVAATTFWNTLPTDVLRLDGSPGSAVIDTVPAPGSSQIGLPESREYAIYLVTRANTTTALDGPILVIGPDGSDVRVGPSSVSSTVTMGSTRAVAIGTLDADAPGQYVIEVPATTDGVDAALYVVESADLGSFMGGVFGSVAAALAAGFLGIAALALLVTGGIMWGIRRGNARSAGLP